MASPAKETRRLSMAAVARVQALATDRLGLEYRPGKETLVRARAARHMRELGISDATEYMRLLLSEGGGTLIEGLLDRLTTNHTAFWREPEHFEWLRERLSAQPREEQMTTIWCAAASTGEEPYTLAMVGQEVWGPAAGERLRILATDVCAQALEMARHGAYSEERLASLPPGWRERYFEPCPDAAGHRRVRGALRDMVHFRRLNLVDRFPQIGPFPFVFCRNVMIYFSPETKTRIAEKLIGRVTAGGHLVVGHAEGLTGLEAQLEYVQPAVYRRRSGAGGGGRWR
jgi:chemotaxis protein methyltransferase CheR